MAPQRQTPALRLKLVALTLAALGSLSFGETSLTQVEPGRPPFAESSLMQGNPRGLPLAKSSLTQAQPGSALSHRLPAQNASATSTDAAPTSDIAALEEMAEWLNRLPAIRVIITQAPGNGHQAASVNVMRRLRQLGFQGEFEVVFDNTIRNKLDTLLPGFRSDGPDSQRLEFLGGMTVLTEEHFLRNGPRAQLPLGITGADDATVRSANQLRVDVFLKLQPMDWHHPSEIILGANRMPIESLKPLGAVYETPRLTESERLLEEMAQIRGLDHKVEGLRLLLNLPERNVDFLPVYGVGIQGTNKLTLLIRALQHIQKTQSRVLKKSIVLPIISNLNSMEIETLRRQAPAKDVYIGAINDPATQERLQNPRNGEIVLVLTGSVTQSIFDLLFSKATLPATVAGKNAAHLMHRLGKPYLNMMGAMPTSHMHGIESGVYKLIQNSHLALRDAHLLDMNPTRMEAVAAFIADAAKKKSPLRSFFEQIGVRSQGLANDKVFQGLREVRSISEGYFGAPTRPAMCRQIFGG